MTTKFLKTTGIPLYKVDGKTYCNMIHVLKMIHHECYETENEEIRTVLDRMEARLVKNDIILPDAQKPTVLSNKKMPGRYAVGRCDEGKWTFYCGTKNDSPTFSDRPCEAELYVNYRDASACADFLEGNFDVLDFEENLTEEQRWLRELMMPFPYDADEGNYHSIPVQIVT